MSIIFCQNISIYFVLLLLPSTYFISISRGKLSDRKFVIDEEKVPIIREKAVKSLGSWYQADLNDGEQAVQFRKMLLRD